MQANINQVNRQIQKDIDDQIIQRDYAIAGEDSHIMGIKEQRDNQNIAAFVFEVKYAKSAKEKSVLLEDKFSDALKDNSKMQDKEKKIILQLRQNGAINAEVMFEYGKLVK